LYKFNSPWGEPFTRLRSTALEGLIEFVAFLVQTLGQNNRILIREIPGNSPRICKHFGFFALTLEPETLEESIKGSKDSHYSLESNKI